MDALPDEIIVYLFSFLTPREITTTHLVCHRFLRIGRDNNLWRDECFEISRFAVNLRRRNRAKRMLASKPHLRDLRKAVTEDQVGERSVTSVAHHDLDSSNQRAAEKIRVMANWDPSYQDEKVDWYTEFIHRTASIGVRWFQKPLKQGVGSDLPLEVRGIGTYYLPGSEDVEMTIGPLEDGSVCLWDVKGSIIGRSAQGSLRGIGRGHTTCGIMDGVSVNSSINRAFIAVEQDVMEVDLQTLRTVSQTRYPSSITVMSEARGSTPITIGTSDGNLHLYDPRSHRTSPPGNSEPDRLEGEGFEAPVFRLAPRLQRDYNIQRQNTHSVPLSILHMFDSGEDAASDIFVAGRFTSIMNYDRRSLSKPRAVIHSGARISALSYIPYSFSKDAAASMRYSELSLGEVRSVKSTPGSTLIACGEYGGRGSLDLYGLSELPPTPPGRGLHSAFKNRLTSSTTIVLSVIPHGSRLVISDGNGNLKWVERDGLTEVRQWNISHQFPDNRPRGIFGTVDSEYESSVDIARKLLPTRKYVAPAAANMDNLLLWSGEKIGLVHFSNKQNSGAVEFEEVAKSLEERHRESSERTYRELTRRALEAQADEGSDPQPRNTTSSLGPDAGRLTDEEASRRVERCFKKRQNNVQGRILWKNLNSDLALGQESLDNIRIAADNVFFDGMLCGKVKWRWSRDGEEGYETELLGSTTPQYSPETGIEARIVLSQPLLLSGRYSRDLILSTFLHELVHCYLFICCGDQAQKDGGHTPGFQQIVQLINGWIGNSRLRLCSMKADLDHFTIGSEDLHRCSADVDGAYQPPPTSQYADFGDCTFVNVSLPPLAYVSMQERMMQPLGGSVSMPIVVE
ncbi:hypothetical protein VE03_00681 [Pseudogymnoascus sp. 23342-1-I1]|nr:hypothetical protein VE03_00681 [Pseudogymnoascus sp. 23342-1-I1]